MTDQPDTAGGDVEIRTLSPANTNSNRTTVAALVTDPTEEPESGLVHPVLGYLVCILVLVVFGTAIGIICFRHYRRKKATTSLKLLDEEGKVQYGPVPTQTNEEPVKTVVFKRNGKDAKTAGHNADDEVAPMLSGLQDSESLSDSIAVELIKYTKKTEDLPMIDEADETEANRSDDKLAEEDSPDKVMPSVQPKEQTQTTNPDPTDSEEKKADSENTGSTSPTPPNLERTTWTESQVLEMLDTAEDEENRASVEVKADIHTPTGDQPSLPANAQASENKDQSSLAQDSVALDPSQNTTEPKTSQNKPGEQINEENADTPPSAENNEVPNVQLEGNVETEGAMNSNNNNNTQTSHSIYDFEDPPNHSPSYLDVNLLSNVSRVDILTNLNTRDHRT